MTREFECWDVIVIGAGIHGAGVAQAAAAAGYRCLVLEQYDQPARATSSRSSKLIHGGLRYLEHGRFALVRQCLRERELLLKNAPHLVELIPFIIPVYRETRRRPLLIHLGLILYALFSRRRFHRLDRSAWSSLDGLDTQGLEAVFRYYDARTDDAKLTRAVIASAEALGAVLQFDSRVSGASIRDDGVSVTVASGGAAGHVTHHARCVVNATGPWAGAMHACLLGTESARPDVELVRGTHIVLPGHVQQAYYLEAPQDRRAVFVLPWQGQTMVGTTEISYRGDPAEVRATDEDVAYLLQVYNHYFSSCLTATDVVDRFAGLRVLPVAQGTMSARSRDTLLLLDDPGQPRVASILGGKLTAYRSTAADLMQALQAVLPAPGPHADTASLRLPEIDV